jgi:hypothetical protein
MTHIERASGGRRFRRRGAVIVGAAAIVVAAACNDSNVPFLTAPTQVPNSATGIQQAVTGLIASTRIDMFQVALELSAMSRELTNFTNTEPRFIEYDTGIDPTPVGSWIEMWANEYQNVRTSQQILAALPAVTPAYSSQQLAGLQGMVQTIEAFNYLLVAWAHDTEGFVIMQSPNATALNPLYCLKDGMTGIVALLDSANVNLNTAGSTPFPFKLPPGFAAVGQFAGPSTKAGAFAAWNRALAAKARLELAYAMANPQPSFTSMGGPNQTVLASADSAMKASALFQPTGLPVNPSGGWSYDNFSVLLDFSSASGDQPNPMNTIIGTQAVLSQVPSDQDTVHDLRWKAKFVLNPAYTPGGPWPVQQAGYSQVHAPNSPTVASVYIVGMYPSPGSPLPVTRSEDMTLTEAMIRLGLNDGVGAMGYVNDVRSEVGGLAPLTLTAPTDIRNQIMKEQEISTIMEGGADRLLSIQLYNVAAQVDTTWEHVPPYNGDVHTSMFVLTAEELSGRGGTWNPSCP